LRGALVLGSALAAVVASACDGSGGGPDASDVLDGEAVDGPGDAPDDAAEPGETAPDVDGEVSVTCGNGVVEGGEECDDANAVAGDGCESGCRYSCHTPADCEDANVCTTDQCYLGGTGRLCSHEPADCDDDDPCTTDSCDPLTGCRHDPAPGCCLRDADCDDENPCTSDLCDERTGTCRNPVAAGAACDDGLFCTAVDQCESSGACVGSGTPCDDGLACTTDECGEAEGACSYPLEDGNCLMEGTCRAEGERDPGNECRGCLPETDPAGWSDLPAGTSCDDGDPGTSGDACDGRGTCSGYGCPAGMVLVPAGRFVMGSDSGEGATDEEPEHIVVLSSYCIDVSEVTNSLYRECVTGGACTDPGGPGGPGDEPVTGVTWAQAAGFCAWQGKRLPTEAEWEKAARGGCEIVAPSSCGAEDERTYPWGDEAPACERANMWSCGGAPDRIGGRPLGDSPYGVQDMAGNAAEWVADWYYARTYLACGAECTDPAGPGSGTYRVVRGGNYGSTPAEIRAAVRVRLNPTAVSEYVGIRCASAP
jgi:cysteine-rich repeat protein